MIILFYDSLWPPCSQEGWFPSRQTRTRVLSHCGHRRDSRCWRINRCSSRARAHPESWVPSHRTVLPHAQQLSEENATLADIQHFPGNARWYQSSTAAQAGLDKTESASKNGNSETWKAEDVKLQYISVPLAKSSLFLWEKADGSYK